MSIMKSISTTIQFDTLVFLNLGKNCLQVPNDSQVMQQNRGGQCVPHIFFLGLWKSFLQIMNVLSDISSSLCQALDEGCCR